MTMESFEPSVIPIKYTTYYILMAILASTICTYILLIGHYHIVSYMRLVKLATGLQLQQTQVSCVDIRIMQTSSMIITISAYHSYSFR